LRRFFTHLSALQLLALFTLCLFVTPSAFAKFQLTPEMAGLSIMNEASVIEDANRRLTIDDIVKKDWAEFKPQEPNKTVKGMSTSAWWVMLDVENQTSLPITWVLEAIYTHTDYLNLYHIDSDGFVTMLLTGDKRAFSNRPIASESFAFPFSTAENSQEKIVMRFAYHEIGMIELSTRAWEKVAFHNHSSFTYYFYGCLFGAGLFVIIFTLIVHIPTRLPEYYWYIAYLTFVLANSLANTGLGHRFMWHDSAYLTDSAHIIITAFAFICALQFNRIFLQTKQFMPRADYLLKFLITLAISSILFYLNGYRGLSGKLLMLTSILLAVMPLIGLWAWKVLKRSDARWYVYAWSVWSVSMIVIVTRLAGVVEISDLVLWISRMGLLLQTVLLGLALIDHVNVLRKEKQNSEDKLIASLENANTLLEEKVQARTAELELAHQEAVSMAETDVLTGIGNRRFFFSRGEEALQLAKRLEQPLSLVMIDIDHFKKINDTNGHAAGDIVIKQVAETCKQRLRSTDIHGRIGGEEFACILMGTNLDEAKIFVERLRKDIEGTAVASTLGAIKVTASFGISAMSAQDDQLEALLHRADEALYQAKSNGRNRVEFL